MNHLLLNLIVLTINLVGQLNSSQNQKNNLKNFSNIINISGKEKISDLDSLIKKHISSKKNLLQKDNFIKDCNLKEDQFNSIKNSGI